MLGVSSFFDHCWFVLVSFLARLILVTVIQQLLVGKMVVELKQNTRLKTAIRHFNFSQKYDTNVCTCAVTCDGQTFGRKSVFQIILPHVPPVGKTMLEF